MAHSQKQYISTTDLARFLGISSAAILKRINSGKIKAVKIGRSYAIPHTYLKEHYPEYKIPLLEAGEYLSIMEAANILGITRMAVYQRIQSGKLAAQRVGRHYVIARDLVVPQEQETEVNVPVIDKDYVSIPELAKIMGCSRIYVFKQVQKGIIKAKKVGRHYVIARDDAPISGKEVQKEEILKTDYLSVADVAAVLGVSRISVFNKIKNQKIKAIKIGRSYAISRQELRPFYIEKQKDESS